MHPQLVLDSTPADAYLAGHCSSCPKVKFRLEANTLHHKLILRELFDAHTHLAHRHWRDVAKEMCEETDPARFTQLCDELTETLTMSARPLGR